MRCKSGKDLIKISLVLILAIIVFCPTISFSYNKPWDQGHKCTNPGGGDYSYGRYDYDGVFQGGNFSKECCILKMVLIKLFKKIVVVEERAVDNFPEDYQENGIEKNQVPR